MFAGSGEAYGGLPRQHTAGVTPIASSIIIKSISDLQSKLASALDVHIAKHPLPGVCTRVKSGGKGRD